MTRPLLALSGVAKAYNGVPVLTGVDLAVAPGEIHALMGENGAGKSTLIRILAGVVAPDRARIEIDGEPVGITSPAAAHRLGLRFIHQEFNVVPALSVAENMVMGRPYPRRAGFLVDWRRLEAMARDTLARLGITHIDPARPLGSLALGDQMLVRISSAFLGEDGAPARLYVMDEPTAGLTRAEAERLFGVLRTLGAQGASVIYVSHRLDEILSLCDRATVLRDGRSVDSGRLADITHDDLVAMMIGRKLADAYPPRRAAAETSMVLELEALTAPGLGPIDLGLGAGEILGVAGLENAGQQALLRALFGDLGTTGGRMRLAGRPYRPASPAAAWRAGLAYVPRERRAEGLVLSRAVFENVTLPHLGAFARAGAFLAPRREQRVAAARGEEVRLRARGVGQPAAELSGGNQQKVVFARALAGAPRLLLLDEPTRGVDVGARFDIYAVIRDMAARGMAVILASSDLAELIGLADRIAVLREGRLAALVEAEGLAEESLVNLCYGRAAAPDPVSGP